MKNLAQQNIARTIIAVSVALSLIIVHATRLAYADAPQTYSSCTGGQDGSCSGSGSVMGDGGTNACCDATGNATPGGSYGPQGSGAVSNSTATANPPAGCSGEDC